MIMWKIKILYFSFRHTQKTICLFSASDVGNDSEHTLLSHVLRRVTVRTKLAFALPQLALSCGVRNV